MTPTEALILGWAILAALLLLMAALILRRR
jgi:uncharacterized protein (TIGR03382 family)